VASFQNKWDSEFKENVRIPAFKYEQAKPFKLLLDAAGLIKTLESNFS